MCEITEFMKNVTKGMLTFVTTGDTLKVVLDFLTREVLKMGFVAKDVDEAYCLIYPDEYYKECEKATRRVFGLSDQAPLCLQGFHVYELEASWWARKQSAVKVAKKLLDEKLVERDRVDDIIDTILYYDGLML